MCRHTNFDDHDQFRIAMLDSGCNNITMPLDGEINTKVVDYDQDGGIAGEDVQKSFTTEASGRITVPSTAPDGLHFKTDMLANGLQCCPAATSVMSQTQFPIIWFLRAGCDAIFTGRSSLKDKTSGHGEISLYELTENSKNYKGMLALNCWNDLWFFKYSISSPARHTLHPRSLCLCKSKNNQQRPKLTCLQDTPRDAGFMVRKCKREMEMRYW